MKTLWKSAVKMKMSFVHMCIYNYRICCCVVWKCLVVECSKFTAVLLVVKVHSTVLFLLAHFRLLAC